MTRGASWATADVAGVALLFFVALQALANGSSATPASKVRLEICLISGIEHRLLYLMDNKMGGRC